MKKLNVDINGKFYRSNITGVQRYAHEIVKALDLILDDEYYSKRLNIRLILPSDCIYNMNFKNISIHNSKYKGSHLWEQFILPYLSWGNPLLSLSGSIPLFKIRQYCTIHDAVLFDKPEPYKNLFKILYKLSFYIVSFTANNIFTVSKFSQERLKIHLPLAKKKLVVAYNGSDHLNHEILDKNFLNNHGLIKNGYYLMVGSNNANKNIARIADIVNNRLGSIGFSLVIVGESRPHVFKANNQLKSLSVKYLGYVSDDALKSLYLNARAFIFPSIYEGFGIPLIEAMSFRCPILASNAASIPEVCGLNAIYFNPLDNDEIYTVLSNYHLNSYPISTEERISLNLLKFSWKNSAVKIIDTILNTGP